MDNFYVMSKWQYEQYLGQCTQPNLALFRNMLWTYTKAWNISRFGSGRKLCQMQVNGALFLHSKSTLMALPLQVLPHSSHAYQEVAFRDRILPVDWEILWTGDVRATRDIPEHVLQEESCLFPTCFRQDIRKDFFCPSLLKRMSISWNKCNAMWKNNIRVNCAILVSKC